MASRKKVAFTLTASLASAVGLIGVLHMPFARGLLRAAGGCPVGHSSVAEREPARQAALARERGQDLAPARPALGFALDQMSREEVRAWAERSHVDCENVKDNLLRCADVPASAVGLDANDGAISVLTFGFGPKGVLRDVSTMRMNTASAPARAAVSRLEAAVGAPQVATGSFDDTNLARLGAESLSQVRYRYRDYFADVIAMRLQADGLVVREHFMSAND
jgi:hypothetical protein